MKTAIYGGILLQFLVREAVSAGWRIVVRPGQWNAALRMSSKPTTEISSGTRSLRSLIPLDRADRETSLNANRAVKHVPLANNFFVTTCPSSGNCLVPYQLGHQLVRNG